MRTSCFYAALIVAVLALIRLVGERWWPVVLLLYTPRWLFFAPLALLAILAGCCRRRTLWLMHGITALAVAVPLMQISLPISQLRALPTTGPCIRIMTLNRGARGIDAARLIRLIERERIDLICLQEGGNNPIMREYWKRGWHRTDWVASRFPVLSLHPLSSSDSADREVHSRSESIRVRPAPGVEFAVASVHLDTVRRGLKMLAVGDFEGFREHAARRAHDVERLVAALDGLRELPVLVGGDFNIPSDSSLFAPIRARFQIGYDTAGWNYGYTYPTTLPWVRIDHILASPHWTITRCWVGPDVGSDHLPLIAEVVLSRSASTDQGIP